MFPHEIVRFGIFLLRVGVTQGLLHRVADRSRIIRLRHWGTTGGGWDEVGGSQKREAVPRRARIEGS